MKTTLTTTFTIALMVFAFNAAPSYANEETNKKADKDLSVIGDPIVHFGKWMECGASDEFLTRCNEKLRTGDFSENEQGIEEAQEFAYQIGAWCSKNQKLREAICSDNGFEWIMKQFAGLTRRQKQQQDEDDWNAWILQQFAVYNGHLDSDSKDGSSGRDIADSGTEDSTSAAGTDEQ
ncbi:MAG: hypothetical protein OXF05_02890 [Hyphomicrobiales bacterium]|nr:hypothetical protein [Hyphomicrobiales bacterium]MCY4032901.1 hypothetical protein [Hyphomicrobiales bacterium]